MKLQLYFKALIFLLALALSQACIKEHYEPEQPVDASTLLLRIEMKDTEPSRATEPGQDIYNENKVQTLKLAFYQEDALVWTVDLDDSNLNTANNYIIAVPQNIYPLFDGTKPNDIYVIANPEDGMVVPNNKAELAQVLVSKNISEIAPSNFLILGSTTKTINMNDADSKNLGNVELKRLAAKVRINRPVIQIEGYELVGLPQAKLRNYVDKAHLIEQSLPGSATHQATEYRPLGEGGGSAHYYSYFNSWNEGDAHAPEMMLWLRLKKTGEDDTSARNYYYRVPIKASDNQIKSNYLYDLSMLIEVLGSLTEEDPVNITGNLLVKNWSPHNDAYGLPATEFLVVAQKVVKMNNVSTYKLAYQSSKKPISINITKVQYRYVNANGQEIIKVINPSDPMYPSLSADPTHINITSAVPINNVPKEIYFDVTNGVSGFKESVIVYQYPSRYIINTMGTASNLQPGGNLSSGLDNKAIYHIVVLVPPGDMILGFPPRERKTFHNRGGWWPNYNYPVAHTDFTTANNIETSRMVSPSFELASQFGATSTMVYAEYWSSTNYLRYYPVRGYALCNCATYWEERMENGVVKRYDDWRLPTEAEIALVDQLQMDSHSAVKKIMTGKYYWDAYSDNNAYGPMQGWDNDDVGASPTRAHIRCVRDVKNDINQGKGK